MSTSCQHLSSAKPMIPSDTTSLSLTMMAISLITIQQHSNRSSHKCQIYQVQAIWMYQHMHSRRCKISVVVLWQIHSQSYCIKILCFPQGVTKKCAYFSHLHCCFYFSLHPQDQPTGCEIWPPVFKCRWYSMVPICFWISYSDAIITEYIKGQMTTPARPREFWKEKGGIEATGMGGQHSLQQEFP